MHLHFIIICLVLDRQDCIVQLFLSRSMLLLPGVCVIFKSFISVTSRALSFQDEAVKQSMPQQSMLEIKC